MFVLCWFFGSLAVLGALGVFALAECVRGERDSRVVGRDAAEWLVRGGSVR